MPKIPSLLLRIEVSWRLYFFLFQMMLYVLFSMSLLIYFGLNTNLAYISKFGEEDLVVYNYLFTSQREPHSVPDRDFFATLLLISSHFELSRILPKLTASILMETVTILVVLVDQFYFYMHQPIKPWLFEKIIFWASLSLHFHMVINYLYPIKAGNIS